MRHKKDTVSDVLGHTIQHGMGDVAAGVGFEPTDLFGSTVFKTVTINQTLSTRHIKTPTLTDQDGCLS